MTDEPDWNEPTEFFWVDGGVPALEDYEAVVFYRRTKAGFEERWNPVAGRWVPWGAGEITPADEVIKFPKGVSVVAEAPNSHLSFIIAPKDPS